MTVELYRDGERIKTYESTDSGLCAKARRKWVKEVAHLPGEFYIKVIRDDRKFDMEKFEKYLQNKLNGHIKESEIYERMLFNLNNFI